MIDPSSRCVSLWQPVNFRLKIQKNRLSSVNSWEKIACHPSIFASRGNWNVVIIHRKLWQDCPNMERVAIKSDPRVERYEDRPRKYLAVNLLSTCCHHLNASEPPQSMLITSRSPQLSSCAQPDSCTYIVQGNRTGNRKNTAESRVVASKHWPRANEACRRIRNVSWRDVP